MARTKMLVVGAKEKIEIAYHLAALGAFDGPSHAAHPHSGCEMLGTHRIARSAPPSRDDGKYLERFGQRW